MTEGEMQQHLAAMIESFDTKFRALGEQLGAVFQEQQKTNQRLDQIDTKVDGIKMRVDVLETRFDKLETRFEGFAVDTKHRLERIESHLQLNGSHRSSPRPGRTSTSKPGKTRSTARSGKKR